MAFRTLLTRWRAQRLRSRLTVVYAGLFGATLLLIFAAGAIAVSGTAQRQTTRELTSSGEVFDSLLTLRAAELETAAGVLARDYGFRAAVATGDRATEASALANLQARLNLDLAFVVSLDGEVTQAEGLEAPAPDAATVRAIQDADATIAGLMTLGGRAYHAVAAPVQAPELLGWVVFARSVDADSLTELQDLAAIPLTSAVLIEDRMRLPVSSAERDGPSAATLAAWRDAAAEGAKIVDGVATLARPLPMLGEGQATLLLRYPLSAALSPYKTLFGWVSAFALFGLALAVLGSWAVARSVTRPILALDAAARRVRDGETPRVDAHGGQEVASLAHSFNAMATRVREREAALSAARDVAETASQAKDVFLANMSHELRTPLNGVLGLASMLSGTTLDARQRDMLSLMERSAGELRDVLGNVLDLTNLKSGRGVLNTAPFDLHATLDRLAAAAHSAAAAKGLQFEASLPATTGIGVSGDEARVASILSALLSNAVKFTDAGGVSLTVERNSDGAWRMTVRDTGVGFGPDQAEALFTPFRQADGSSTRRFGGAGLGLSLARELALAMGGALTAESIPGRGSAFTATLPLPAVALPETAPAGVLVGSDDEDDAPHFRVLVADDHQTNRKVVELILSTVGAEMVGVENGAEALAAYDAEPFDAVLMDIQMPVMDGLEAIRGIRAREAAAHAPAVPIVVLSANALPDHHAASLAAGADDHIDKPVTAPALIAALERAVARCDREAA